MRVLPTYCRTCPGVALALLALVLVAHRGLPQSTQHGPDRAPDLRTNLERFAHDSLNGRAPGTRGHVAATDYLANQLGALGVRPLGRGGTYFATLPLVRSRIDESRAMLGRVVIRLNEPEIRPFVFGVDYLPLLRMPGLRVPWRVRETQKRVVFGGTLGGDRALSSAAAAGKVVVLRPPLRADGSPDYQVWNYVDHIRELRSASAVLVASLDVTPRSVQDSVTAPFLEPRGASRGGGDVPPIIAVSRAAASQLLMTPIELAPIGVGEYMAHVEYEIRSDPLPHPVRLVLGAVDGGDEAVRSEAVLLLAHSDHLGTTTLVQSDRLPLVPAPRQRGADTVFNGANEGGSGAVALLEIARRITAMSSRPRRSIVFAWVAGGEHGHLGLEWLIENPPVARNRIVAALSLDAIARVDEAGPQCRVPADALAARRVPSVLVRGQSDDAVARVNDEVNIVDFAQYARVIERALPGVLRLANTPGRPRSALAELAELCAN